MMGLAIAHQIREQVVFTNEPIVVNPQYQFSFEKQQERFDCGDKIVVI